MNLFSRFLIYQKERFPLAVLLFTTFSVVLSSAVIILSDAQLLSQYPLQILIGTLTCLLYMFLIRVFDDYKDQQFDEQYHKDRPIQRGLIKLKELQFLNLLGISLQFILNLFLGFHVFFWLVIALVYSLIARAEFFSKHIRKHFLLYNFLNLMQIFFLQLYLYALFSTNVSWLDPLLYIHFVFVMLNAGLLDVARKLKKKNQENPGKDTYSAQLGMKKASLLYASLLFFILLVFSHLLFAIMPSLLILLIVITLFFIMLLTTYLYLHWKNKITVYLIESGAVIYYLATHLLLVVSVL